MKGKGRDPGSVTRIKLCSFSEYLWLYMHVFEQS